MGTRIDPKYHTTIDIADSPRRESGLKSLGDALSPALDDLPRLPQQARSREKRDGLLRAAAEVFAERGYAATTADAIADAARVSVGTFYNYFRNKRQILLALVVGHLDDIFGHLRLAQVDLSHGNAYHQIRAAVAAALSMHEQSGLRRVWQEFMSSEPELVPYQQIIRGYAQERLIEQLRQTQRRGGTWDDLDIEVTALAILALVDSLSMRSQHHPDDERLIRGVSAMIYRAIYCTPS